MQKGAGAWLVMLLASCDSVEPVVTAPPPVDDYYSPQANATVVFSDRTYDPAVRTVRFTSNGIEGIPPILGLPPADRLELHFDLLGTEAMLFSYTVLQCDAQWQPTDMPPISYLSGVFNDFVPTPTPSRGTQQPYMHYALPVPVPAVSGNYLLKVYRDTDADAPVLTRRFMKAEQAVSILAAVRATRDVERRDFMQQVDLTIAHPGLPITDPFADVRVTVLQNMRWDDARTGLQPRFTRAHELVYDFPTQALFEGGNEWRPLDASSVRYLNLGIQRIITDGPIPELVLAPDPKRNIAMYGAQPDLNGRHLVRTDDGYDPTLEADYVIADWSLPLDAPLYGGQVFVYGAFSDFQLNREYRCSWDEEGKRYHAQAMVKQGYIDYCYAFLSDNSSGTGAPDLTVLEGSHYQTENEYMILVYLKDHTLRTDRLIAARSINSRQG